MNKQTIDFDDVQARERDKSMQDTQLSRYSNTRLNPLMFALINLYFRRGLSF